MYLMPEDGQNDRNMLHVLSELIKFAMPDGIRLSVCKMCGRLCGFGADVKDGDSMYLRQDYRVSQPRIPQSK
jgi:hypothetical protein